MGWGWRWREPGGGCQPFYVQWVKGNMNACCVLVCFELGLTFLQSNSVWASCSVQTSDGGWGNGLLLISDGLIETHQGVDHASAVSRQRKGEKNKTIDHYLAGKNSAGTRQTGKELLTYL